MEKRKQFSQEELDYLINNYAEGEKEEIILKINRNWNSIQKKAHRLKIRRLNYDDENYKTAGSDFSRNLDHRQW